MSILLPMRSSAGTPGGPQNWRESALKSVGYSLYVGVIMKENNSIDAEDSLVYSPLCQRVTRDGTEVNIQIYNDDNGGWLLEVVDEFWNSTVWDDSFTTDSAALAEALKTIDTEGIASLVGSASVSTTRHWVQ